MLPTCYFISDCRSASSIAISFEGSKLSFLPRVVVQIETQMPFNLSEVGGAARLRPVPDGAPARACARPRPGPRPRGRTSQSGAAHMRASKIFYLLSLFFARIASTGIPKKTKRKRKMLAYLPASEKSLFDVSSYFLETTAAVSCSDFRTSMTD